MLETQQKVKGFMESMQIQPFMGCGSEENTFTVTFHSMKKIGEVILLSIRPQHPKKLSKDILLEISESWE